MSVEYRAVNWNRQKRIYDLVIAGAVPVMVGVFFGTTLLTHPYMTAETGLIRGLGLTAFLLLHVILVIGPLCRLHPAFLPLLYNRRHLGVAMCLVGLGHAAFAVFQYHALGDVNPVVSLLVSNPAFGSVAGFPFELLGLAALLILLVMAATSHDFWLSVLSPPLWKALHMMVYLAYALLIGHVALGVIQTEGDLIGPLATAAGAVLVIGLHLAAGIRERAGDQNIADAEWVPVCRVDEIKPNRARIALVGGERVAVFRYDGKLSCVSNVCRHQNGPLGEGKVVDGCITCPWHGYQYQPDNGTSPPPFTDKVATYNLRIDAGRVLVHSVANAPGTRVEPVPESGSTSAPDPGHEFYIGYLPKAPPRMSRATRRAVVTFALLGCGTLVALALAQPPFAAATFEYGHPHTIRGVVSTRPYPVLRVNESGRIRQYLLAGQGKHGAGPAVARFDGQPVSVLGTLVQRGNDEMLELAGVESDSAGVPVQVQPHVELGSFTLTGEIVDGKCWLGVMNPGEGKTHLDCAVRCISGGLPPMLVVRDSGGAERHMLLTDASGAPMPRDILPAVGRPVSATGRLSREGDLFFFSAAPAAVRVLTR